MTPAEDGSPPMRKPTPRRWLSRLRAVVLALGQVIR